MRGEGYRVAIVQKSVQQYRLPFFNGLRHYLADRGVELRLIYGQPSDEEASKGDAAEVEWGHRIRNTTFQIRRKKLYWQPCLYLVRDADLVVVEQASKLLVNYLLLSQQLLGIRRIALWGHGRNFKIHDTSRVGEALKRFVSTRVHWWFAYNEKSASIVEDIGFPRHRITRVQNAIDTRQLRAIRDRISRDELRAIRDQLGIGGSRIGLFVGGMYGEKRLDFLLEACGWIRRAMPDFEMIFVGAGPEEERVRRAAAEQSWIHYVGPKFDEEKVACFLLADVFLMPGLVGLAILDAFALEVPIVTTDLPFHSPEIEYLIPNENGIIVEEHDDAKKYAEAVIRILSDPRQYRRLVEGCRRTREMYTVENMVERFARGIISALQ